MRIIAGSRRGRHLSVPRGIHTRPTADRVREAMFSIVGPCAGANVLDLFAGSGALGIEALSRGAGAATFVDRDPRAANCVRSNLGALGLESAGRIVVRDWRIALRAERQGARRYDLCLIDPPYSVALGISALLTHALAPLLSKSATVVFEGPAADAAPILDGLRVIERTERIYGSTRVVVARVAATEGHS